MRRFLLLFCALGCLLPAALAAPKLEEGDINGALYAIARPDHWNGRLLLLAHGHRPEGQPLHAKLYEDTPPVRTWVEQGWMVAISSYRRNGLILREAIADLEALREHITQRHGTPARIYLMGESMGGAIVTLIAEHFSDHYAGAVAIGAALDVREPAPTIGLVMQPQMPLLFLTNQSEIAGPSGYVQATQRADKPPVLWRIARDGHVNVNSAEKIAALAALVNRVENGADLPADFDATIAPPPRPSRMTLNNDGSGTGRVTDVHPVYGNLTLDLQPDDLRRLSIEPNVWFGLVVGERLIRVFHGAAFGSVKRGEWVAFPDAEGWLAVAINRGHAAADAKLAPGDAVTVRRLRSE